MPVPLHLLILEDNPFDAELEIATLEEAGYHCQWKRVETRQDFLACLDDPQYDLILADYSLPAFDGLTALKLFSERGLNMPFILVSGTLGEEIAIESLKAGATDYVLKTRLGRLGPVVHRALREKAEQRRRIQAESELRKLSWAVQQSPASIVITDLDGNIEYVNPKFTEITGYTLDEVIGKNPRILQGGCTSQEEYEQLWQTVTAGEEWRGEFRNKKKNGEFYWEAASISPIKDEADNITHFLAVKEDVTERKRIEAQAQQQDRLAAIGQMAAGVAHDFNNILAVISLYTDLMLGSPQLPAVVQKQANVIARQSKRAADLIQQILDFSRRAPLERIAMDLSFLTKELVKLWQRTLPENIKLSFDYDPDGCMVFADPARMQQMFMNLVINARDAMPDGGELAVGLKRIQVADDFLPLPGLSSGNWVQIMVKDSGIGIPQEALAHLFEPFFTTKPPGEGTGLGLAQVYGIVRQHDGYIDVVSEVGEGTTFTIYLPVWAEADSAGTVEETAVPATGGGEMILVVEDDAVTREALVDSLELLNYRVLSAQNGREGLTIVQQHGDDISLIVSDRIMPDMGGEEMLSALKRQGNTIPFVLISGYVLEGDLERLRGLGMTDWLLKPINLEQLAAVVSQTMRRSGQP